MDPTGPIEAQPWPERLTAHVVTPGDDPRIHGYSIEADLARHYRTTDAFLLALTGEIPSDADGSAFEIAMHFASATSIAEAPAHAAALARICAATTSAMVGTAAVCAGEQARFLVERHEDWIRWLDSPTSTIPPCARAATMGDDESVRRFRDGLSAKGAVPTALALGITRDAAILAVLHHVGLRSPEQMQVAVACARLPMATAEALRTPPTSFRQYPMRLPEFVYEAGHD